MFQCGRAPLLSLLGSGYLALELSALELSVWALEMPASRS